MTIVFPVPEALPDPRAPFIQVLGMASALAGLGASVRLIAGWKKGFSQFPFSWHGLFHAGLLFRLLLQPAREKARAFACDQVAAKMLEVLNLARRGKGVRNLFPTAKPDGR